MILAIVGSTELSASQEDVAVLIVASTLTFLEPDKIVSGGAKGVDTIGENHALFNNVPFKKFLPDIQQWNGKWAYDGENSGRVFLRGFKERNQEIADACTHLLRLTTRQSKTYGSGWTADRAREQNKPVWEVYL